MSGPYDDLIDLPHPTPQRHPRMSMANRAAQFSPFAALSGYGDAVKETARLTDGKAELTEEEKSILDAKLQALAKQADRRVTFTYFQPDGKKQGGAYLTAAGIVKKFDRYAHEVVIADGLRIPIDDILDVHIEPSRAE